MQIRSSRILITGASGGMGGALVRQLAAHDTSLGLVGRRTDALQSLAREAAALGAEAIPIAADITDKQGRAAIVETMRTEYGGTDILVNNAGTSAFTDFLQQTPEQIEALFTTNAMAPMLLSRAVLPEMVLRGQGQIVNIGSTFGSIAFAWFTSYSASKFALRGFSEALRRELDGTGVRVTFVAPRAVKTSLNSAAVYRMAEKVKMNMDEPDQVAAHILRAIEQDRKDVYLGFPEALFVRINSLLPRLVDLALRKQNREMKSFAREV